MNLLQEYPITSTFTILFLGVFIGTAVPTGLIDNLGEERYRIHTSDGGYFLEVDEKLQEDNLTGELQQHGIDCQNPQITANKAKPLYSQGPGHWGIICYEAEQ